jgi:ERCC4-type nuclease
MGRQSVSVTVDVHEPDSIRELLGRLGATVEVDALAVADYRAGRVLVERKSVNDLHRTLAAGRFFGQLARLRAAADRAVLLVEGPALDAGAISPAAIRGALLAAAENDVTVVRSESLADSALWVYRIACRSTARVPAGRARYAKRPRSLGPNATSEAALAAIPGVSAVSARALLQRFGSLERIVSATDAELTDVYGIGPVRSQAIRAAVTHRHVAFRSRQGRERPDLST